MRILKIVCICCVLSVVLAFSAFAAAPVILTQPQTYFFPVNQEFPANAYFSVLADGNNLSYQWQVYPPAGGEWINLGISTSNQPNLTVVVSSASNVERYLYRCIVSSSDGETISNTVTTSAGTKFLSMQYFMDTITSITNFVFDLAGRCCNAIVSEPILLFTVGFLALGGSIAIVSRLLSRS